MWKTPHKIFPVTKDRKIVLYQIKEMTMGNDMGFLAVAEGEKVLFKSNLCYHAWEDPIILGNRFAIITHSRRIDDKIFVSHLTHHVYDLENLNLTIVDIGKIKAGGYKYQKEMKFGLSGNKITIDSKRYNWPKFDWQALSDIEEFESM